MKQEQNETLTNLAAIGAALGFVGALTTKNKFLAGLSLGSSVVWFFKKYYDYKDSMSYTDLIDQLKKNLDDKNRDIRRLHHEIENLEVAVSNMDDDRNVAYYNSKIQYAENTVSKDLWTVNEIQNEIESLMQKIKAEAAR